MSHRYTVALIAFLHVTLLSAQGALNVNQVRALFHSNGMISNQTPPGQPFFQVPAQPDWNGPSTLFAGSIWIAGMDANSLLHVAAERFGQGGNDFFPGPLGAGATITQEQSDAYDRLWTVYRNDVWHHLEYFTCLNDPDCDVEQSFPNYTIPQVFLDWPAHGDVDAGQAAFLAPFVDFDGDGLYDPTAGDAPCVPGDQALFAMYNDRLAAHTESGGAQIGVEVHMTPFAYASNDPALAQTVFVRYRIHNRGGVALNDTYIGFFNDFDLGAAGDDHLQCDVARNLMMVLNSDNDDSGGSFPTYGMQPPAFGLMVLKGPLMDPDGEDNTDLTTPEGYNGMNFNDAVMDNERLGLTYFSTFENAGIPGMSDPNDPAAHYNYLRGIWNDNTPMSYGGTGYSTAPDAVPARFLFPGDSDPLGIGTGGTVMPPWTEASAGNPPTDRRALGSIGPFTFGPGAVQEVLVAYIYARAGTGGPQASMEALRVRADSILAFATTIHGLVDEAEPCADLILGTGSVSAAASELGLFPNPVHDQLTVRWPERSNGAWCEVLDGHGSVVLRQRRNGPVDVLEVGHLPAGLYLVRVQGEGRSRAARFVKQ